MEGIVDGTRAVGFGLPGVEARAERLTSGLDGEVDDRRGATPGGGPGSGLERVGGRRAPKGHLHVGVGVDTPGDHVLPGRVEHHLRAGPPTPGEIGPTGGDGHDAFVFDEDVHGIGALGTYDDSTLDECAHGSGLPQRAALTYFTVTESVCSSRVLFGHDQCS